VIDGGKEQVEFASRAADDVGVKVAMVGLAKKDEEIYMRAVDEPVRLKRDDYALRLLQRVRDEAHRFAVLYHRTVRSARYESELRSIEGVGASTVRKVLAKFNTRSIVAATADEIAEKAGITKKAAQNIYDYYHPTSGAIMKKKYRLVACDLDGTLLNDELTVSERNLDAIAAFRAQGGIFTVATGRSPLGVVHSRELLGLDEHTVKIACNLGCLIVDSGTLEIDRAFAMTNDTAARLIRYSKPHCDYALAYTTNSSVVDSRGDKLKRYCDAVGFTPEVVDDLSEYASACESEVIKVVLILDERRAQNAIAALNAEFPELQFIESTAPLLQRIKDEGEDYMPILIECITRGADKGEALKIIAAHYGVDMSEVIAFGDSFNDIPMIKAAGLGVAMGNAREPIKLVADIVADTNNNDGVAKIIEEYCLG
ncbi:MAG: Cof-type HAD-IIB family hydrolase, partial [Clostridiales bacterium]|nr:Cof-type HAD-IIB family hydrolase [Clostridiales bacterium]